MRHTKRTIARKNTLTRSGRETKQHRRHRRQALVALALAPVPHKPHRRLGGVGANKVHRSERGFSRRPGATSYQAHTSAPRVRSALGTGKRALGAGHRRDRRGRFA